MAIILPTAPLGSWSALAAPSSADAAPVPFEDRFADNSSGWPELVDNAWLAEDGYHLIGRNGSYQTWRGFTAGRLPFLADLSFEVELRIHPDATGEFPDEVPSYGIFVRGTDDGTVMRSYRLEIHGRGHELKRVISTDVFRARPVGRTEFDRALKPHTEWNTLKIVVRGETLAAYINGEQVAWAQEDSIRGRGALGLWVADGGHVVVRRVRVTRPTNDELRSTLSTALPLVEDFRDGRLGWPHSSEREWRERTGPMSYRFDVDGYHVRSNIRWDGYGLPANPLGARPVFDPVGDVSVELDVAYRDGPKDFRFGFYGVAIMSERAGKMRSYQLQIIPSGSFRLMRDYDLSVERELVPWQQHPALRTGEETNTLRLEIVGKTVYAWINGQQVAAVADDADTLLPPPRTYGYQVA